MRAPEHLPTLQTSGSSAVSLECGECPVIDDGYLRPASTGDALLSLPPIRGVYRASTNLASFAK